MLRSDWKEELGRWLKPFLDRLGHKARRQMCPLYVSGLIGPGDRKSIAPMAKRLALGKCDQLHHFIAAGIWDAAPPEAELLVQVWRIARLLDLLRSQTHRSPPLSGRYE
jgi:SRSO17 transposase